MTFEKYDPNVDYLANWSVLNEHLQELDEETVLKLLKREMKGERRSQFLIRLYGRYNMERTKRERREVMAGTWQSK